MTSATLTIGERLRAAALVTALTASLTIGCARADEPSSTVDYRDLNLSTEQGSQLLYARIVAAANAVCVVENIRVLKAVAARETCREQSIARAVRSIDSPRLAAIYAAHRQHS